MVTISAKTDYNALRTRGDPHMSQEFNMAVKSRKVLQSTNVYLVSSRSASACLPARTAALLPSHPGAVAHVLLSSQLSG